MALIQCPECGKDYSEHAKSCPNCGYSPSTKMAKDTVEKTGNIMRGVIVVIVSIIISALVTYLALQIIPFKGIWLNRGIFVGVLVACISISKSKGWIGNNSDE